VRRFDGAGGNAAGHDLGAKTAIRDLVDAA